MLRVCDAPGHGQRPDEVSPILGLPDTHEALMYVPLGHREGGEAPAVIAPPRVAMDEYVSFGRWEA